MRLRVVHHGRRRAVRGEFPQHKADALIVRPRVQLPVRESAGAALAELDVALRVEGPSAAEGGHLRCARLNVLPTLYHHRAQPRAGEGKGAEHPRRAEPGHDGRRPGPLEPGYAVELRRLVRLAFEPDGDGVHPAR